MNQLAASQLPANHLPANHLPAGGPQDIFFPRSNPVPLPLITRADGIWMWDEDGNAYIDASSGPVVSNIGHGNKRVAAAMAKQAEQMDFAYSRVARHQPNIDLSARIAALAGPGYERVCFSSGGSEAMEIAIKFLRQYALATGRPEKRKIITLFPSYHGGTVLGLALSGDSAMDSFIDGMVTPAEHVPAPFQYRIPPNHTAESFRMACAEALDAKIRELGPENVLAFVAEPVGGLATGAQPLMEDYANRVREICTVHGVHMVYDEILCGSGRTGTFLASHAWPNARADIVVLAKGLASGYAPLAATLIPAEMADHLASLTGFGLSHTYAANPVSCAVGLAVLDECERQDLFANAAAQGAYLKERLEAMKDRHPAIGDVRGRGLLIGVELVADRENRTMFPASVSPTDEMRILGLKEGLILYARRTSGGANGDWMMISPPLTITRAECDDLLTRFEATLAAFEEQVAQS
ncbi:MAG: aminotransferase class III-fold pyridoxal phosphate-dependent enzyme [Alphaproteobacteria bacterium]|nr:aminotransferase class III-fold pyridoxal phosphate-dependent enzyme [Alphaproteobacteria bacterium]